VPYGTFSYDVMGGEDLSNKELFQQLKIMGFINDENQFSRGMKFL
jgi:hypothetical protein